MFWFLSLFIANAIELARIAGKDGGTAIVIKSRDLKTMFLVLNPYSMNFGIEIK